LNLKSETQNQKTQINNLIEAQWKNALKSGWIEFYTYWLA
jgi:hypothetical protein